MNRLVARAGIVVLVCVWVAACQLKRPDTTPARMLEPQLLEPQLRAVPATDGNAADAVPVRLLDTQARGHIGRRLLYQQTSGELTEDPIWRWSLSPDRYLDTAIRLEVASSPRLRLVDIAGAPSIAATLVVWYLEPAPASRLIGAVQFEFTRKDGVVKSYVAQDSEPISSTLPGDLAVVAGRLMRRLAGDGLMRVP